MVNTKSTLFFDFDGNYVFLLDKDKECSSYLFILWSRYHHFSLASHFEPVHGDLVPASPWRFGHICRWIPSLTLRQIFGEIAIPMSFVQGFIDGLDNEVAFIKVGVYHHSVRFRVIRLLKVQERTITNAKRIKIF